MNNHAKVSAATWVSNGPVQINVGRDLHVHGGASALDIPDDCVLPRGNAEPGFEGTVFRIWSAAELVVSAVWFVGKVFFWVVIGLLVLCVALPAFVIALSLWLIARLAELSRWIITQIAELPLLLERKLGGGPTRLVYVPSRHSRRRTPTPLEEQELDSSEVELLEPGNSGSFAAAILQTPSIATTACRPSRSSQRTNAVCGGATMSTTRSLAARGHDV